MEARQPVRRRARQPRQPTRRRGEGRRVCRACRARSSGMSGPIVGHVGPDRRACRARSSGMSGPIVGHVGPDRRACRARSSGMSGPTSGDRRVVACQKLPFSASIDSSSNCHMSPGIHDLVAYHRHFDTIWETKLQVTYQQSTFCTKSFHADLVYCSYNWMTLYIWQAS